MERQFETIGEVPGQLARLDPEIAGRITEHRQIIAFRSIQVRGCARVDDLLARDRVETRLAGLSREAKDLLGG